MNQKVLKKNVLKFKIKLIHNSPKLTFYLELMKYKYKKRHNITFPKTFQLNYLLK